ncbi:MAG: RdgB/HAM1 family non-canonical purine NTP pyrophosphatase [Chloroflexi bacterium]|nr:RdgB/HAM1 family non-canonical purine NTP pyrophosphatase [Chloroflexota bacterium]
MGPQRLALVIATRNAGKLREFKRLFSSLDVDVVGLAEAGIAGEVEETGRTFEENACIKAVAYGRMWAGMLLADDSGLEVDALGGEPGVKSARYGDAGLSDEERVRFLLEKMKDVPGQRRTARFRSVLAIVGPGTGAEPVTVEGVLEGAIACQPLGSNGFGYDPVFWLPEQGRTVAQLSAEEKDEVSHRGRASRLALPVLRGLLRG